MKITGRWALIALAMCGIYVIGFPVLAAFLEPRGVPTVAVVGIVTIIEAIFFVIMVRILNIRTDELRAVLKEGVIEFFTLSPQKLGGFFLLIGLILLVVLVICEGSVVCMTWVVCTPFFVFEVFFSEPSKGWVFVVVWLGIWFTVAFNIVKIFASKLKKRKRKEAVIRKELEPEKLKVQLSEGSITQREYEQLLFALSNLSAGIITLGEYEQKKKELLEK